MYKNQRGFGAIEAIIIIVIVAVLGFAGWYVWKQNQKSDDEKTSNTQQTNTNKDTPDADPYAGWLTCNDTAAGLTFKYPAEWTTEGTTKDNPCGIKTTADAPADGNGYARLVSVQEGSASIFIFFYTSSVRPGGTYNVAGSDYKGETILDVTPLNVPNAPKPLSLVAYASDQYSPGKVGGLVLTDQVYTVGQKINGSIPYVGSKDGKAISMSASLASSATSQAPEELTLDEYKKHPDYQTAVNVFKSISY